MLPFLFTETMSTHILNKCFENKTVARGSSNIVKDNGGLGVKRLRTTDFHHKDNLKRVNISHNPTQSFHFTIAQMQCTINL